VGIRGKLSFCAASAASAVLAAAASLGASVPSGIYLSTWGTAHVAFGDPVKAWLRQSGASVAADGPMRLDADRGGFTMPAGGTADADRLDAQGRMVYPGDVTVTLPGAGGAAATVLRFGPCYLRLLPDLTWTAQVSVNGAAVPGEVVLATGAESEVLAGGGSPSPSGFRAAAVPYHVSDALAQLLARESGQPGPAAGSLFGTLVPQFDHVPTGG
jgi:hypothetical protein